MPRYYIYNPGPNMAIELKPEIGEFRIKPNGRIEVPTKELADAIVYDSQGHLRLVVVD